MWFMSYFIISYIRLSMSFLITFIFVRFILISEYLITDFSFCLFLKYVRFVSSFGWILYEGSKVMCRDIHDMIVNVPIIASLFLCWCFFWVSNLKSFKLNIDKSSYMSLIITPLSPSVRISFVKIIFWSTYYSILSNKFDTPFLLICFKAWNCLWINITHLLCH